MGLRHVKGLFCGSCMRQTSVVEWDTDELLFLVVVGRYVFSRLAISRKSGENGPGPTWRAGADAERRGNWWIRKKLEMEKSPTANK